GIEFSKDGSDVFVADTARGAVWEVALDGKRQVEDPLGCDPAYTVDTLCPDSLLVENPQLEGADGLVLDVSGHVWVAETGRKAMVGPGPTGGCVHFSRPPPGRRPGLGDGGPLETPTSPIFPAPALCTTRGEGNRRDNSPNSAGEVGPGTG